jgi:hypothetical protein
MVVYKPSKLRLLWILALAAVLLILFVETQISNPSALNVLISGAANLAGATVYIDGKPKGTLQKLTDSGLGGAAFWTKLPDGKYSVEVRKPGFCAFRSNLDLHSQAVMAVELATSGKLSETKH